MNHNFLKNYITPKNKKMMKKIKQSILILAMLFLTNPIFSQKSIELKYRLQKNDQYQYTTQTNQNIKMDVNGMEMSMDMNVTMNMVYKIVDQNNENNNISGEIKQITMSQSLFGMSIDYDSDKPNPDDPMLAEINDEFQKILNSEFHFSIDPEGKINSIDLSNINENNELANNFNSGTSFAIYPKNNTIIGETWSEDIVPAAGSDMKYMVKYTLLKIEDNHATIGIEGVISANSVNDVDLKLEGTVNGEMIVDSITGWLIESFLTQNLEMDIEQDGIILPATLTGTIKNSSNKI